MPSPHTALSGTTQELCNVWFYYQVSRTSYEYAPDRSPRSVITLSACKAATIAFTYFYWTKSNVAYKSFYPDTPATTEYFNVLKLYNDTSLLHMHPFLTVQRDWILRSQIPPVWIKYISFSHLHPYSFPCSSAIDVLFSFCDKILYNHSNSHVYTTTAKSMTKSVCSLPWLCCIRKRERKFLATALLGIPI